MSELLFVYGSLRKGGEYHSLLEDSEYIADDFLAGYLMYREGDYPVLVESGESGDKVFIEIYRINNRHLAVIDRLEGFCGKGLENEYERIQVMSAGGYTGYVYIAPESFNADIYDLILPGDWIKHKNENCKR